MEKLELDTWFYGNGHEKDTLLQLMKIDNAGFSTNPKHTTPLNLVQKFIEMYLEYVPEEYFDDVNKAYGLCLAGKWENLTDEEYALLNNVLYYLLCLEDYIPDI